MVFVIVIVIVFVFVFVVVVGFVLVGSCVWTTKNREYLKVSSDTTGVKISRKSPLVKQRLGG